MSAAGAAVVTLPRLVRWGLVAGTMLVVAWIRVTPAALDGVEREAEQRARQTIAARLAAAADDMAPRPDPAAAQAWIATHPTEYRREVAAVAARLRDELRYEGADGRAYPYLADFDSYLWLRHARNYLRHGTTCDAVVDGECRDTLATAPVGAVMRYARSLHIVAIVALHRAITLVAPEHPLPATAFLVPVIVGTLGVLPAFGIGRLLAGDLGGVAAAVLVSVNPLFVVRSFGGDNDVWNVVLPLCLVWATLRALVAAGTRARVGWTLAAAACTALHAATWSGWVFTHVVTLAGLAAVVVVRGLALAAGGRRPGARSVGPAVLVLTLYAAGAGLGTTLAGARAAHLELPGRLVAATAALWQPRLPDTDAAPATGPSWPDTFATISELVTPGWTALTTTLGGPLLVFAAWIGLLVMLLPIRGWRPWHFLVLIAGNFLYLHLVTTPGLARGTLVVLLSSPLLASAILALTLDRHRPPDDPSHDGRLLVAAWFMGALLLAHDTARFLLLLVAPFGVAVGVALGRLAGALRDAAGRVGARTMRATAVALPLGLCLALAPWVQNAHRQMTYRLPEIDDAWWHTLTALRQTPAATIVFAWWDYGHWIKYVAERAVATDGGNLGTHVPHWLGRALAASDERESIGLLRMLACGSDATPEPEADAGAFGRLRALGVDEVEAYRFVGDVARQDRDGARTLLRAAGLDTRQQTDVLAATHCTPPPARLLVTNEMAYKSSWWHLGRWNPARAAGEPPPPEGSMFFRRRWIPCTLDGDRFTCPFGDDDAPAATAVTRAFEYPAADPGAGRVVVRAPDASGGAAVTRAPAVVILATEDGRDETVPAAADPLAVGALVDVPAARVLLGHPDVLRSTFTALLFLDGRPLAHFVERGREQSERGRLVTTWEVVW